LRPVVVRLSTEHTTTLKMTVILEPVVVRLSTEHATTLKMPVMLEHTTTLKMPVSIFCKKNKGSYKLKEGKQRFFINFLRILKYTR
jgi:hypothetical protein